MDTTAPQTVNESSKYDKDLIELEVLKKKAKEEKPKPQNTFFFQKVLLTSVLFFALFIIGFFFSYEDTKQKVAQESAKFTPKAEINLPTAAAGKCSPAFDIEIVPDPEIKNELVNICSPKTKESCENVDRYNETKITMSGDGKADCVWSM